MLHRIHEGPSTQNVQGKKKKKQAKIFLFSETTDMASIETVRMTAARTVCIPPSHIFFSDDERDFEKEKR